MTIKEMLNGPRGAEVERKLREIITRENRKTDEPVSADFLITMLKHGWIDESAHELAKSINEVLNGYYARQEQEKKEDEVNKILQDFPTKKIEQKDIIFVK